MWQSVTRRVYQQISNKDVDIRGETLHFMQQKSELQRRNLWSFLTHFDTWNKITPSSLLLKLLYNLPHQHNFSTSMGLNGISLRRSVFHRDCRLPKATEYAVVSTFPCLLPTNRKDWLGYSDARRDTTTATWPEKVVTEAIDHRMLNLLNKRFALASQQTNVYVVLLL